MKIKCSVNFYLEKRIDKLTKNLITTNVPIFLYFSFGGKRVQYYTGYRIDNNQWNESEQRVKRNNISNDGYSSAEINGHLDELRSKVTDIYKEAKALKMSPTIQYIRDELKERIGDRGGKNLSFFNVFDQFIETESQVNTWTESTIKKFNTNLNHLKQFQDAKRFKIEFENLDEAFFARYVNYLREELNHRNTTIAKNLKILKWFLNWATRKGFNKNFAFREFNPDLKGTSHNKKIIFLAWDELMSLYHLEIEQKYLEKVRDVFCFCCFTGLRYSDVYNLRRSNIKPDCIEITTIKTDDPLQIELNTYSRAILSKYNDVPLPDNKALPVISNQKMNEYLKELGQKAKMFEPEVIVYFKGKDRIEETYQKWQLLSTHAGRRTFISNALFFNIPSEVIMSWTGHSDHKVMENYYKIIAPHKRREMNKFNENGE